MYEASKGVNSYQWKNITASNDVTVTSGYRTSLSTEIRVICNPSAERTRIEFVLGSILIPINAALHPGIDMSSLFLACHFHPLVEHG
jgi:hypothetical protein